jgi:hypothetical protein
MLQGSHPLLAKPHSSGEDCLSLHVFLVMVVFDAGTVTATI